MMVFLAHSSLISVISYTALSILTSVATIITITTTTTIIVILAIGIIKGCPPGTGLSQGRSDERPSS